MFQKARAPLQSCSLAALSSVNPLMFPILPKTSMNWLLLWRHIADSTMNPFAVIPALYVLKDCSPSLFGISICVEIDFFLFQHRMERFYAGVVIRIPFTAEWMKYPLAVQVTLKCLTCVLTSQITMEEDSLRIPDIQTGIFYCLHCQFSCHGCPIGISDDLTAA